MRNTAIVIVILFISAAVLSLWPVMSRQAALPRTAAVDPSAATKRAELAAAATRRTAVQRASRHLDWADAEIQLVAARQLQRVHQHIVTAKKGTPQFAEDVLGLRSKWYLVLDYVPFVEGGRHERFVRQRFEDRVLNPGNLQRVIESSVREILAAIIDIENQALVRIEMDLEDLPRLHLPGLAGAEGFDSAYRAALQTSTAHVEVDLGRDVTSETASLVIGEVLAWATVRLAMSAGVIGAGGMSGVATFGVGIVVGLIVDQVISRIWDWLADPAGDLSRAIDGKLDDIERTILKGSGDLVGMEATFRTLGLRRATSRRRAILSVLNQGPEKSK